LKEVKRTVEAHINVFFDDIGGYGMDGVRARVGRGVRWQLRIQAQGSFTLGRHIQPESILNI
jgi:hypothetical protein